MAQSTNSRVIGIGIIAIRENKLQRKIRIVGALIFALFIIALAIFAIISAVKGNHDFDKFNEEHGFDLNN